MEGPAFLLAAVLLLSALAIRIRGLFRNPLPSTVENTLLIAGCAVIVASVVNETQRAHESLCRQAMESTYPAWSCERSNTETASHSAASQAPASAVEQAQSDQGDAGPLGGIDKVTAVYDIAAHTVYLPNGAELEAHSGLGDRLDNPRYVHEHMRGATPPNTYELTLRERPFHGVRALRLVPVGNQYIFGRKGLLAHTYMLGPKGDSNGCVVFKNYQAFLQAYDSGEVRRLLVVPSFDEALAAAPAPGAKTGWNGGAFAAASRDQR
jgi:hypothetical protein